MVEPARLDTLSFLHDFWSRCYYRSDLGLGELVHRALPDLELHTFTSDYYWCGKRKVAFTSSVISELCRPAGPARNRWHMVAVISGASDFEVEVSTRRIWMLPGPCASAADTTAAGVGSCAARRLVAELWRRAGASHPMSPRHVSAGWTGRALPMLAQLPSRLGVGLNQLSTVVVTYISQIHRYVPRRRIYRSFRWRPTGCVQIFNRGEFYRCLSEGWKVETLSCLET